MYKIQQTISALTTHFYGEYNQNGQLCTKVFNGKKSYYLPLSPKCYIERTLISRGFNLEGAMESSKKLLGNKNMRPIVIDAHLGIFLFPSKSPNKPDCIWFSLLHVTETKAIGRSKTEVYFHFGHSIIVEMKESNFKKRMECAQDLRRIVSENTGIPITFYFEPKRASKLIIKR